jgi:2-(1,2-epoxy-1,2-dihydrophenyl)acetyl-CoA isomerase
MAAKIDTGSPTSSTAPKTASRRSRSTAPTGATRSARDAAALEVALDAADRDDAVRAVVLTGAGSAFCAGGDVKGMDENNRGDGREAAAWARRRDRVAAPQPAQHRGPDLHDAQARDRVDPGRGGRRGLSFALACDLRIASENAVFTTAFAKVGFSGDYGGTYFLTQVVGSAKARELYTALRSLRREGGGAPRPRALGGPARRARRPHARARAAARERSDRRLSLHEGESERAIGGDVIECLDLEATHHVHSGQTRDHKAAVRAFVEKREPKFEGR